MAQDLIKRRVVDATEESDLTRGQVDGRDLAQAVLRMLKDAQMDSWECGAVSGYTSLRRSINLRVIEGDFMEVIALCEAALR